MKEITRLERDSDRIRGIVNSTRINLEKIIRDNQLFTKEDAKKIKSVVHQEWPKVKKKVLNLAQEVFDEVL